MSYVVNAIVVLVLAVMTASVSTSFLSCGRYVLCMWGVGWGNAGFLWGWRVAGWFFHSSFKKTFNVMFEICRTVMQFFYRRITCSLKMSYCINCLHKFHLPGSYENNAGNVPYIFTYISHSPLTCVTEILILLLSRIYLANCKINMEHLRFHTKQ